MVVMALVAVAVSLVTLSLRDPASAQLDREAMRLAALLETARAESRSSGVCRCASSCPRSRATTGFRFVGADDAAIRCPRSGWAKASAPRSSAAAC